MVIKLGNGTRAMTDRQRRREIKKRLQEQLTVSPAERASLIEDLQRELLQFEKRFGMSSQAMLEKVRTGEIRETSDTVRWAQSCLLLERLKGGAGATNTIGTR